MILHEEHIFIVLGHCRERSTPGPPKNFYQASILEKRANSYLFETWIVLVTTFFHPPLTHGLSLSVQLFSFLSVVG